SECDPPESQKVPGLKVSGEAPDERCKKDQKNSRHRNDHAGLLRRVTHERLQKLRKKDGGTEENSAKHEHHQIAARKIKLFEQMDIHNGFLVAPLPNNEGSQTHGGKNDQCSDETRPE